MAWNVASNNTLEQGVWRDWTPSWKTGTDLWGATQMTNYNHRWTKVGGCVYAHGHINLGSTSNFGNGTDTWTLWFPNEWGSFVDSQTGGRFIGEGWAASSTRAVHFGITMINTFNGFAVPITVQHVGMEGNFNAGADNTYALDRSRLQWISNGGAVDMFYQLRFVTDPNT